MNYRSTKTEMLDMPEISKEDLVINLEELDFINNFLGGHSATIKGLKYFIKKNKKINSIIDVGCGGGDTLGAIAEWSKNNNLKINLTGIDILPEAISFASEKYGKHYDINFVCCNYKDYSDKEIHDIAINSLICHHFYEHELNNFIHFNNTISRYGFIINDLHRHPLAYYSISVLTKLFSNSLMVKNDAPLSVMKGFTKQELSNILSGCGIKKYYISWEWAFRYLVIADHEKL